MPSVSSASALGFVYQIANQNKEELKNVFGFVTFAFGLYEAYDLSCKCYKMLRGRITAEPVRAPWDWKVTALNIVEVLARVALLLSGATSRPGVALTKWSFSLVFTPEQLQALVGGAATNFATDPTQLRHRLSVLACLLGIPSAIKLTVDASYWLKNRITGVVSRSSTHTNQHLHYMNSWNAFTSRPSLHFFNGVIRNRVII